MSENLEYLRMNRNQINQMDTKIYETSSNLRILYLMENKITAINFEELRGDVYLDDNNIQELNRFGDDITLMILTRNKINVLPRDVLNRNLETLKLTSNDISHIDREAFQDSQYLEMLWLNNNKLTSMPVFTISKQLTFLDASNNNILFESSKTFSSLENLEQLDISGNSLGTTVDLFNNLKKLEQLSMKNMNLTSIPLKLLIKLKSLWYINLDQNRIKRLEPNLAVIDSLKYITLSRNGITSIDIKDMLSLNCLDVRQTAITKCSKEDLKTAPQLKILYGPRGKEEICAYSEVKERSLLLHGCSP